MTATVLFSKSVLVLVLSSFMIATAVSFLRVRLEKKEAQFKNIIRVLGIPEDEARLITPAVRDEYSARDYLLPVGFATLVCLSGFIAYIFGADLVSIHPSKPDLVLSGAAVRDDAVPDGTLYYLRMRSMLVISLAFIGAFIWAARDIVRRLIAGDLTPSAYYSAGLRMVYAALLSLMLSFLLKVLPFPHSGDLLPVVAFLAGMLPDQALVYLREKIPIFSRSAKASDELPLEMIEGMNGFHAVRLGEVGIDNAQNLAEANILELLLKTPFNAAQLIDWIAQAKLYTYVKADIEKLRRVGIRTVFDLKGACGVREQLLRIAAEVGASELALSLVYAQIKDDRGIERLFEFRTLLGAVGADRGDLPGPHDQRDLFSAAPEAVTVS